MTVNYAKEGRIAVFTLNRPEAFNALDQTSLEELSRALIDFKDDETVWVGIITGAGGKAFCAGADIKTKLPTIRKNHGQPWADPPTILRGLDLWKPMIAAINGYALGGGLELALACDLRIASENAVFGCPEVSLGLIPGWGGTQRLPRLIGRARAAEIILTGQSINALEAYHIGLINKLVPPEQLLTAAREMAELVCRQAPLAVRAAKQAMAQGLERSLGDGLELEKTLIDFLATTEDFAEGCDAFLGKRKANFTAR
ncbi:MAG: enoyl-CoA hydratase/isomerase family protein [Chloroflexi bacterium]|nr:enoyl-CoA hydratase/isomerase family protein [Chloroflexota bacterium]